MEFLEKVHWYDFFCQRTKECQLQKLGCYRLLISFFCKNPGLIMNVNKSYLSNHVLLKFLASQIETNIQLGCVLQGQRFCMCTRKIDLEQILINLTDVTSNKYAQDSIWDNFERKFERSPLGSEINLFVNIKTQSFHCVKILYRLSSFSNCLI